VRASERLQIIDLIGRELQSRYGYTEIITYLAAFDIPPPPPVGVNSKWVYSKVALATAKDEVVAKIADDLGIGGSIATAIAQANPPAFWRGRPEFRLFISHISKDKGVSTRLKECLAPYGVRGFVAHQDINPTLEWQTEIERALHCMDAMVAGHTKGFSESNWTQQEIGFALGRGVKVISFKMGEDPTGFVSKRQALARQGRTAEIIAKEIDGLLKADPLTADRVNAAQAALSLAKALDNQIPF
jgi:hypothetical protein